MSEKYKKLFLNTAAKLESLDENFDGEVFDICQKIVAASDEEKIKILLGKINLLASSTNKKIKLASVELYNSLLLFLGSEDLAKITSVEENGKDTKSLEELMAELNNFVGLKNVKEKINELIAFHKCQILREKAHLKNVKGTLHMAFIGNPGTGKTSVARIIGHMYKKIGLLSKGHFVEVSRTDLIAGYQGQTALKVKKVIEKARGGVLFIDEAYSITENSNSDSYGRECLTELTKALEDYRDDLVVIVAGYKEPMDQFFESNLGLKSRFNTFLYFDDYDANQLFEIFEGICNSNDYKIADGLREKLFEYFSSQVESKKEGFANGRLARNLFDNMIINHAKRIVNTNSVSQEDLSLLTEEDFSY